MVALTNDFNTFYWCLVVQYLCFGVVRHHSFHMSCHISNIIYHQRVGESLWGRGSSGEGAAGHVWCFCPDCVKNCRKGLKRRPNAGKNSEFIQKQLTLSEVQNTFTFAKWWTVQVCFATAAVGTVSFAGTFNELPARSWNFWSCHPNRHP